MSALRENPGAAATRYTTRVLIAFGCVYFFWGSTFVAIRYGVAVLPPLVLGSTRYLIAGPLMLVIGALMGMQVRFSWGVIARLALIGVLMLGLGNQGLVWAEQFVPSGLAALLFASVPLFVALTEVALPSGEALRARGWVGVGIGFAGLLVLVLPGLRESRQGHTGQLVGAVVTVAAALAWSSGSVLARRSKLPVNAFVAAGWEMTFGGIFNLVLAGLFGGKNGGFGAAHFGAQAWMAIGYLVVFGSMVGYTAYTYVLDHVPVAKAATYAYVNPVVAVVLGAWVLKERLVGIEYVGMAAILVAVYLVTSSKLKSGAPAAALECVGVESEG